MIPIRLIKNFVNFGPVTPEIYFAHLHGWIGAHMAKIRTFPVFPPRTAWIDLRHTFRKYRELSRLYSK